MSETASTKDTRENVVGNMGMNDDNTSTRLLDKNYSPMIVRKYQYRSWPLYIHIICDASLSDLDDVFYKIADEAEAMGMIQNDIQASRNFCGYVSDKIMEHYDKVKRGCVESLGVAWYVDKCFISSLAGDCMTHLSCRQEFYSVLQILPLI